MKNTLLEVLAQFQYPDPDDLEANDLQARAMVWKNRQLLLRFSKSEIVYNDAATRDDFQKTLALLQQTCLECSAELDNGDAAKVQQKLCASLNAICEQWYGVTDVCPCGA